METLMSKSSIVEIRAYVEGTVNLINQQVLLLLLLDVCLIFRSYDPFRFAIRKRTTNYLTRKNIVWKNFENNLKTPKKSKYALKNVKNSMPGHPPQKETFKMINGPSNVTYPRLNNLSRVEWRRLMCWNMRG